MRPWLAISQPASRMAATPSGLRASAVATPNTVTGSPRALNSRHSRQNPAREPYSYMDSTFMWRWSGHGIAPSTSERKASDSRSPCRIERSPPSS